MYVVLVLLTAKDVIQQVQEIVMQIHVKQDQSCYQEQQTVLSASEPALPVVKLIPTPALVVVQKDILMQRMCVNFVTRDAKHV